MPRNSYLWISEHADTARQAAGADLVLAPDSRSDEVRAAAYKIVDELIDHARFKSPSELPTNLVELLEACRVSLTCGPLLAAIREWVAWTQVRELLGPGCAILRLNPSCHV